MREDSHGMFIEMFEAPSKELFLTCLSLIKPKFCCFRTYAISISIKQGLTRVLNNPDQRCPVDIFSCRTHYHQNKFVGSTYCTKS